VPEAGIISCGLISDRRLTEGIWRELGTRWVSITLFRLARCGTNKAATKVLLESDINAAWMKHHPLKMNINKPHIKGPNEQ
jgi:hypothetical protein